MAGYFFRNDKLFMLTSCSPSFRTESGRHRRLCCRCNDLVERSTRKRQISSCSTGEEQVGKLSLHLSTNPGSYPETGGREISLHELTRVYECLAFIWPYNAEPVLWKNSTRSRPQGWNGDYTTEWIPGPGAFLVPDRSILPEICSWPCWLPVSQCQNCPSNGHA